MHSNHAAEIVVSESPSRFFVRGKTGQDGITVAQMHGDCRVLATHPHNLTCQAALLLDRPKDGRQLFLDARKRDHHAVATIAQAAARVIFPQHFVKHLDRLGYVLGRCRAVCCLDPFGYPHLRGRINGGVKGHTAVSHFSEMDVGLLAEKLGEGLQILAQPIHGDCRGVIAAIDVKAVIHCTPSTVQGKIINSLAYSERPLRRARARWSIDPSFASKAAEQAARIAGVLTLWENVWAQELSAEAMANGIELAQFYLSEAARLADAAIVSAEIEKAETLRKWLLGPSWPHAQILPSEVVRHAPIRALRESPAAKAALATLEKHGWVVRLPEGTEVRGVARKEAFHIVRAGDAF